MPIPPTTLSFALQLLRAQMSDVNTRRCKLREQVAYLSQLDNVVPDERIMGFLEEQLREATEIDDRLEEYYLKLISGGVRVHPTVDKVLEIEALLLKESLGTDFVGYWRENYRAIADEIFGDTGEGEGKDLGEEMMNKEEAVNKEETGERAETVDETGETIPRPGSSKIRRPAAVK